MAKTMGKAPTQKERLSQVLVPQDQQPYKVPENWCWTRIKHLSTLYNGRAFKSTDWTEDGLPIIRIQNLNNPDAECNHYSGEVEDSYLLKGQELLFAWSGTPGTSFGAHIWFGQDAVLNQHIFKIEFDEIKLNKFYFKYAINQQLDMLIAAAHGGAGLQHVTKGVFELTPIPLPPLAEQQRIVARIESLFEKLDHAKELAQNALDTFESRKATVLHKAFTGKLTAKWREEHGVRLTDWKSVKSGEIFDYVTSGSRGWARYYSDVGSVFIRMGNLDHGTIELDLSDVQFVSLPHNIEGKRSKVCKGDILISITADVGMVGLVRNQNLDAYINQHIALVRLIANVDPEYIAWFLVSDLGLNQLLNKQRGATKIGLGLSDIKSLDVVLPPFTEQDEIVRILSSIFEKEQKAKKLCDVIEKIDLMKKSILTYAFRGELGTNDPNEGNAEKSLKSSYLINKKTTSFSNDKHLSKNQEDIDDEVDKAIIITGNELSAMIYVAMTKLNRPVYPAEILAKIKSNNMQDFYEAILKLLNKQLIREVLTQDNTKALEVVK